MNRPLTLLIAAAVLGGAPAPVLAQGWPAAVVASAPVIAARTRVAPAPSSSHRTLARMAYLAPATRQALDLKPRISLDDPDAPAVEIPAKADWTDDQGLRFHYTNIAYKHRF